MHLTDPVSLFTVTKKDSDVRPHAVAGFSALGEKLAIW